MRITELSEDSATERRSEQLLAMLCSILQVAIGVCRKSCWGGMVLVQVSGIKSSTPAGLGVNGSPALNVVLELFTTNIKQDVMCLINVQQLYVFVQKLLPAFLTHLQPSISASCTSRRYFAAADHMVCAAHVV